MNKILIIILVIAILGFIIYKLRWENHTDNLVHTQSDLENENKRILNENAELKNVNKKLSDIKFADENIFKFIRCINIPQAPVCAETATGTVCRSKLINCNDYKLVLLNDPVAIERMKVATDKYYQTGKPHNVSDLTYDIKNVSFFF